MDCRKPIAGMRVTAKERNLLQRVYMESGISEPELRSKTSAMCITNCIVKRLIRMTSSGIVLTDKGSEIVDLINRGPQ